MSSSCEVLWPFGAITTHNKNSAGPFEAAISQHDKHSAGPSETNSAWDKHSVEPFEVNSTCDKHLARPFEANSTEYTQYDPFETNSVQYIQYEYSVGPFEVISIRNTHSVEYFESTLIWVN